MSTDRTGPRFIWRIAVALMGLLICTWLMWNATRVGAARILSKYGEGVGMSEPADQAIGLAPTDPEAYAARSAVFLNSGAFAKSASDLEQAIFFRPQDYGLWMQLANARDQAGDTTGALAAYGEAVSLAPHYAFPRWQLGNLLIRAGRYDEAFAELRRAAISQPSLAPQVIDLTWGIYRGDARAVEAVVEPQTSAARMALAIYFAQRGSAADAIRLFRESRAVSDPERRSLLMALLSARQFPESYQVWASNHQAIAHERRGQSAELIDGGFEGEIGLDDPGFGWQIKPDAQDVQFSLDSGGPSMGARSLLINWNGNPQRTAIISQLVLVEPRKQYQLSFDGRTRNLVTAGSPIVVVTDANEQTHKLAQSEPLPQNTNDWQKFSLRFESAETTRAIIITIERQPCTIALCPIFGQTWFDNFVLE